MVCAISDASTPTPLFALSSGVTVVSSYVISIYGLCDDFAVCTVFPVVVAFAPYVSRFFSSDALSSTAVL